MRNFKKMLISISAIMAIVLSMTACGGSETEDTKAPATETKTEEKVETKTEEKEEAATGDAVSADTWADLQEIYAGVVDLINATNELYEAGGITDEEYPDLINEVSEAVNQLGETEAKDWTEAEAIDMMKSFGEFAEALGKYVEQQ